MAKHLLALMTAFLCTVASPLLAKVPNVNFAGENLTSSGGKAQDLVQQGKTLYDTGQFALAVQILQQASDAFKATGDNLREAMTLSNSTLR